MSGPDWGPRLSAYLDGELSQPQRQEVESHLAGCPDCQVELAAMRAMKEDLDMIRFVEPSDEQLQRYWRSVYNRLERKTGWALLSAGTILLLCYGIFYLIEEFVLDTRFALLLKIGVVAALFGAVILFVSLLRERLTVRRADRYSREVQR